MAKKKDISESAIDGIISDLSKLGLGKQFRIGSQYEKAETIPTAYYELNEAIGIIGPDGSTNSGGIPRGKLIEIFGPEGGGKSNIALGVMANAQKMGYACALIDVESSFNAERATQLGIDVDSLLVGSGFDNGEHALAAMEKIILSKRFAVVVLDSTAALIPKAELEGEIGDHHMALLARLLSQGVKKIVDACDKTKTAAIFINQVREKPGVSYGNPESTPGGKALKFYSSLRIRVASKGVSNLIKKGDEILGGLSAAKIVKNRFAAPHKDCEFIIYYTDYVPGASDQIYDYARKTDYLPTPENVENKLKGKIIKKSKDKYRYSDTVVEGESEFKSALIELGLIEEVYNVVMENSPNPDPKLVDLGSRLQEELAELELANES
jgi:recombination protein RecA